MKKMFLACVAVVMLCACGNKGEKIDGVDLTFGRYELHDSCDAAVEGVGARCRIDFSFPIVLDDTEVAAKINGGVLACEFDTYDGTMEAEAEAYAEHLMFGYRKDVEGITDGMTKEEIENEPWNSLNYAYMQKGDFVKGKGDVLCYKSQSYVYTGGAHGMSVTRVLNFDVRSGELLSPDVLFVDDAEVSLRSAIQDKLIDDLGMDLVNTGFSELNALGYTFKDLIPMPDTFVLGEDGVTFIYNRYSIASYAQGEQRIALPYDMIAFVWTDKAKEVLGL